MIFLIFFLISKMSGKWTASQSESGILRKSEFKEKKEELFVFGYSCKLFRDDDRALQIDQGKHLIPWMGDETLKIDRYDARGALHDLSALEAPSGGYDWRVELTKAELDVEQLCDDERYRAMHTDEDEEEMYKEEELKRLHAAGYGQVGFNYDVPSEPSPTAQPVEVDEPFLPTPSFVALLPVNTVLPESLKQNAIIEKTAKFIATQGAQMEILIKAKQRDNPQFQFMNKDSPLHPYYTALITLVKSGKWPEKKIEVIEEKPPEQEEYLHPSLASAVIESAPAIPSIHYKPSADCDYTLLINKMRGEGEGEPARGDVPPPGTEPAAPPAHIYRPPVLYTHGADGNHVEPTTQPAHVQYQQYAAYYQQYMATHPPPAAPTPQPPRPEPPTSLKSTGLSLMKNYNTDSDSDVSDFDDSSSTESKDKSPPILTPPDDVILVIDKMAAYVARNGDAFADIVRAKNDPRFTFLEPDNMYHAYYKILMQQKRGIDVNGSDKSKRKSAAAPVSFSIKKLKEPDPVLPKPALPYESSSDDESEKQTDNQEETKEATKVIPQATYSSLPTNLVYKMDGQLTKNLPTIRTIETVNKPNTLVTPTLQPKEAAKREEKVVTEDFCATKQIEEQNEPKQPEIAIKEKVPEKNLDADREKESPYKRSSPHKRESPERREKRKHRERKKERSKSESRDSRRSERRSAESEKRRDKGSGRERKNKKYSKEEAETEIISLEDNSDDLIDLTGDQSDTKGECDIEVEKSKQLERRRRAAEFLKKVGVDPAAATALPTSSLASAMVDTLESIRKKKAEEEGKRRRREKRRHRDRYDYIDESERSHRKSKRRRYRSSDENDESDYDSSKKKKRKKDKKHPTKNKKRRHHETVVEEEEIHPISIDLTNTLKVLRTSSPTKDIILQDTEDTQQSIAKDSSEEEIVREKKKEREYSEGEWSSDSEGDSKSSARSRELN